MQEMLNLAHKSFHHSLSELPDNIPAVKKKTNKQTSKHRPTDRAQNRLLAREHD